MLPYGLVGGDEFFVVTVAAAADYGRASLMLPYGVVGDDVFLLRS
jgi:hypothetical protein